MNTPSLFNALSALRRCVFFSFVTAPAIMMFVFFTMLSFNNSVAGIYVDAARQLVANAPAGKVWDKTCTPLVAPEGKGTAPVALSESVEPVCTSQLREERDWQKEVDAVIRRFYMLASLLGALVWVAVEGFPRFSLAWLKRSVKP